jgi:CMP-N-acetylneuraminic acid synthetase
MYEGCTLLAVIPARGGSKGLPDKNILPCGGRPLIAWTISAAASVDAIDAVIVSTDSTAIAETARAAGALVPFFRPAEMATDTASLLDAIKHAWETFRLPSGDPYDYVVVLQPTSPLRTARHIRDAIAFYFANRRHAEDTLASVHEVSAKHGWLLEQVEGQPYIRFCFDVAVKNARRQQLPRYFLPNGAIFIARGRALDAGLYTQATLPFHMPAADSIDVDSADDLREADVRLRA